MTRLGTLGIVFGCWLWLPLMPIYAADRVLQQLQAQAPTLPPAALQTALQAYRYAQKRSLVKQPVLTVVDYSSPSTAKRLWVFDMDTHTLKFNTLVAQGKNSGHLWATHFSNRPGSLQSSIGVFSTGKTYRGHHGYSLRLHGLEPGFNSNAYLRSVVMHGAYYVSNTFVKLHHYLGHSFGCFALNPRIVTKVINVIKNGSLIVAYYPDHYWLSHSKFLLSSHD